MTSGNRGDFMQDVFLKVFAGATAFTLIMFACTSMSMASTAAPRWEVGTICQTAKAVTACTRREALSRATVLDRWLATSDTDRQFCLQTLKTENKESYWSLLDCLGNRAIADDKN